MENKKADNKKNAKVFNIIIYCVAALFIVFAVVLLVREFILFPAQPYTTPPPQGNDDVNVSYVPETFIPLGTPVQKYDRIPVRFYFLEREVSCDICPVGIDDKNMMESVKSASTVAWLSVYPYALPGDKGNCVIAGHNLWKGQAGVFSILKKMEIGEKVAIAFDDGYSRFFEVVKIEECPHDDNWPMTTDYDEPVLTLITCMGDWNNDLHMSNTRKVVICKPTD